MNISEKTRKAQVLDFLRSHRRWVDGPEIANESVGGSEGHRRLRELRSEGHQIQMRRHPDPKRDIWQYLLIEEQRPVVSTTDELFEEPAIQSEVYVTQPRRLEIGQTLICPRCHGIRRPERITKKGNRLPAETICYDPEQRAKPCHRCNGLGLVPNVGPVA